MKSHSILADKLKEANNTIKGSVAEFGCNNWQKSPQISKIGSSVCDSIQGQWTKSVFVAVVFGTVS
jgi:hypothetical protein